MAADNRLSAKSGIDTTDFKTGIAAMNRDLRVLESGFRANAASLGNWSKDATGLEARMKTLTSQIDIQRQKVGLTRAEYERVAAEKGRNSRAAQDLEIKLNKETETLNKMERELRDTDQSLEEVRKSSNDASKGVERLDDKQEQATGSAITLRTALGGLGTGLKATVSGIVAATKMMVTMIAATAALTIGLAALTVGPASDLQETTSKIEVVFGTASDKVLAFGEDSATALGLSKNAALSAAGTYGNLLRAMGLTEDESADMSIELVQLAADLASFNNLDPTEVLDKLRAGLTGEAEPLKQLGVNMNQARIQTKALELGLIQQGDELTAAAKAQAAYAIIMEDTALAQGDFARTSEGLANQQRITAATFENIKATIGTAFLPIVTLAQQTLNDFLQSATFTEGIEELVGWIERLGDILSLGFGDKADFAAMSEGLSEFIGDLLDVGIGIVENILDGLVEALPTLLEAGTSILTRLLDALVAALPTLLQAGVQILLTLVNSLIQNLPMLIDAALQAVITLAEGLADALPELIPAVVQAIITIVETLIENVPMLIDAALALILGLAEGLIAALPILIPAIPRIVEAIFNALIKALPKIGEAAVQLIMTLLKGIYGNLPLLGESAVKLIEVFLKGFVNYKKKVAEVGVDIVKGVWDGISSQWDWFQEQVLGFFTGIVTAAKEALGIQSPSKEGRKIGRNFMGSVALGGLDMMRDVERQFARMTGRLTLAAAGGISNSSVVSSSTSNSFDIFGNVIVQGDTKPDSFGDALLAKRF